MHVALLRGINVGGKNKLPMATLSALFAEAGCSQVTTYIQSGNVVFSAAPSLAARIPALLQAAIETSLGLRVPLMVIGADELAKVARANPFVARGVAAEELHLALLAKAPPAVTLATLDAKRSPPDAFIAAGRAIYLHLPNGVARSKLTNAYFDRALATISTLRNWRTVQTLIEMTTSK